MLVKWIFSESEEILGIKRNEGDSFEIEDWIAKQLEEQKKVKILAKNKQTEKISEKNKEKSKEEDK